MQKGMPFNASAVVSDALNAVQGAGAGNTLADMAARVRYCERLLADHATALPPTSLPPLQQLDELLTRIEAVALNDTQVANVDVEIFRLELTQRILQLGQLIFASTTCGDRSDRT